MKKLPALYSTLSVDKDLVVEWESPESIVSPAKEKVPLEVWRARLAAFEPVTADNSDDALATLKAFLKTLNLKINASGTKHLEEYDSSQLTIYIRKTLEGFHDNEFNIDSLNLFTRL